jgi:Ca2+-binding EF-hand superfamily protein
MNMLNALDADGSGTISLDEFMAYFAEEPGDDDDYHKAQEE